MVYWLEVALNSEDLFTAIFLTPELGSKCEQIANNFVTNTDAWAKIGLWTRKLYVLSLQFLHLIWLTT